MTSNTPKVLGIFFSSGDLGDVGRHAVAAALEMPPGLISSIRVFSRDIASLFQTNWKCGCEKHFLSQQDHHKRIQFINLDCTKDDLIPALLNVDAIVSCLGSRQPFHKETIVREGTERLVQAAIRCKIPRFVMLSSVGIGDDWPPMQWAREGRMLEGFFRTICWCQYQDLNAAEKSTREGALENPSFNYLIVRPVVLSENSEPVGTWRIQTAKHEDDHPTTEISKLDCARLMVTEAIFPSLTQRAIVLGGNAHIEDNMTSNEYWAKLQVPFFCPAVATPKQHDKPPKQRGRIF